MQRKFKRTAIIFIDARSDIYSMTMINLEQDGDGFRLTCPHPALVIEHISAMKWLRPSLSDDGVIVFAAKDHLYVEHVMKELFGSEERSVALVFLHKYLSSQNGHLRWIWLGGRLLAYRDAKTDEIRLGDGVRFIAGGFEDDYLALRYHLPLVKAYSVLEVSEVGRGALPTTPTSVMWLDDFVSSDAKMDEWISGQVDELRSQISTVQSLGEYLEQQRQPQSIYMTA
jgi:hypothetical protein